MISRKTGILTPVMFLKLVARILLLALIVLFVMLIFYPAVHEAGHILAALIAGETVADIGLFPTAYTQVSLTQASFLRLMLLCFSGAWFPLICLLLPPFHNYMLYSAKLTIALITASGSLCSFAAVQGIAFFGDFAADDAALILRYFPDHHAVVTGMLLLLFAAAMLYIVLSKPLKRTAVYFDQLLSSERDRGQEWKKVNGAGKTV